MCPRAASPRSCRSCGVFSHSSEFCRRIETGRAETAELIPFSMNCLRLCWAMRDVEIEDVALMKGHTDRDSERGRQRLIRTTRERALNIALEGEAQAQQQHFMRLGPRHGSKAKHLHMPASGLREALPTRNTCIETGALREPQGERVHRVAVCRAWRCYWSVHRRRSFSIGEFANKHSSTRACAWREEKFSVDGMAGGRHHTALSSARRWQRIAVLHRVWDHAANRCLGTTLMAAQRAAARTPHVRCGLPAPSQGLPITEWRAFFGCLGAAFSDLASDRART